VPRNLKHSVEFLIVSAAVIALVAQLCRLAGAGVRFLTAMDPLVSLCFETAALILWLSRTRRAGGIVARSLSWLILAVGIFRLADLLAGSALYPGPMSFSIAACFCVLGLSMLALDRPGWPCQLHPQVMMTVVLCVALTALIGYAYDIVGFHKYLPMSELTALDFILLGAAVILLRPDEGFMAQLPVGRPGTRSFAWLLPACVLIPWLLGGLTVLAANQGWYDTSGTGSAIAAVLTILAMSLIVFFNSAVLNRSAAELERRNRELEQEVAERKQAEARAAHLAGHDPLTSLPNRRQFLDRLQNAISRAARQGGNFALFYIDVDHFKPVNDLHGHHAGDVLLQALAGRLALAVREVDMVARLGGDEFSAIMEGPIDVPSAAAMAERLCASVAAPYRLALADQAQPLDVAIGISVGIALFPSHADDLDGLVRAADGAMYRAKAKGRALDRRLNVDMAGLYTHP
jgi:diguanylate cyclase (GGDEF)-like protein